MKATVNKSVKIRLELEEDEARWLQGYLQNYLGDPEEEDEQTRLMRTEFFETLKEALAPEK